MALWLALAVFVPGCGSAVEARAPVSTAIARSPAHFFPAGGDPDGATVGHGDVHADLAANRCRYRDPDVDGDADVELMLMAPPHPTDEPVRVDLAGTDHEAKVALTYDAGADRGNTKDLLATLERDGVKATFGMTLERWAEENPDLVRQMAGDGDGFINHTYDHRSFTRFFGAAGGTYAGCAPQRNPADRADHSESRRGFS